MRASSFLIIFLLLGIVLAQDLTAELNNWNPSVALGPRPTPPPPPIQQPVDPRVVQYQQQLAQWCSGCITRCVLWRNLDFGQCADNSTCACPVGVRYVASPFLPINETAVCPTGYAPTPTLKKADTWTNRRAVKKNVVIFLLDDLDETVTPYFSAMPFAGKIFSEQGTHFANAFSSTSVCCAARCQLLTGMYGHNVGVLANSGKYGGLEGFKMPHDQNGGRLKDASGKCINNENRILPLLLQQAGYKTAIWGKYINGFENDTTYSLNYPVPPGWDEFVIPSSRGYYAGYNYMLTNWNSSMPNTNVSYEYFGIAEQDYMTDVVRDKSVAWIDKMRHKGNDPLFMYISPAAPHFPITAARRHQALNPLWESLYNSTIPNRPNFNADVSNKPFTLREHAEARKNWTESPWIKLDFVKRMGSLAAVDEMIAAVYAKFEALGELNKTVFILASDNGYNNGAFGLVHKMAPYQNSVRIPLYFTGGGVLNGRTITEQALLIDLAPTILDFANLQPPANMDGKSFWSTLISRANTGNRRKAALLQYKKFTPGEDPNSLASESIPAIIAMVPPVFSLDLAPYRAIRTDHYMMAEWVNGYANGSFSLEYEAYDLIADPYEMNNIYSTMRPRDKEALMFHMNALSDCSGISCIHPPRRV